MLQQAATTPPPTGMTSMRMVVRPILPLPLPLLAPWPTLMLVGKSLHRHCHRTALLLPDLLLDLLPRSHVFLMTLTMPSGLPLSRPMWRLKLLQSRPSKI